jgi:hypothetical protein
VFKSTSAEQQQRVSQKIRKISETLGGKNDHVLGFQKATIAELYNDSEDAHDFVPCGEKVKK